MKLEEPEHNYKIIKIEDKIDNIKEELHKIDVRLKTLEIAQSGHEQNWKSIINFAVQVIWVVMAAYILMKLGLQPP
jgi:Na+/phosphate symporter